MKRTLILLLMVPFLVFAQEATEKQPETTPVEVPEELDPAELKILEEIRSGKITAPKEKKGIDRINKKSRMVREDSRILTEHMNVGDVLEIKTCFGNPFRISFGESVTDRIAEAKLGNIAKFTQDINPDTRRSIIIAQKEAEASGSVHTTLWLERSSDRRAYIFNITGEPCPQQGLLKYPVEIIVENKVTYDSPHTRVLLPNDFITEITKNYPRNNEANFFNVNGLATSSNALYSSLSVSIGLKSIVSQKKMREPKFIFLDWSRTRIIESHTEYLPYPSQAETDLNGIPTLRFNLTVKIGKKYILERKNVYLIVLYEDEKFYQIAEIPVQKMFMNLKDLGWEI